MKGFTLAELLIALAITMVISAGLIWVADEVQGHMTVQPEVADLSQRARVIVAALERELSLAGAGPYRVEGAGALAWWIPAIYPARLWAMHESVPSSDVALTLLHVPEGAAQARVGGAMDGPGDIVRVKADTRCPSADVSCGFREGQRAVIFDRFGHVDLFTVAQVGALTLQHQPALSRAYREADDARVSEVVAATFYYDAARRQIRKSLGTRSDLPVVDQVVGMSVSYYGDVFPPDRPRPAAGLANCLFDEEGRARLAVLTPTDGMLVRLSLEQLRDGPFCGEGVQRFDADLYRLRRVRVSVRIQVALESLRGRDPLRFRVPGRALAARREVPDLDVSFDIAPRNLQVR